MSIGHWGLLLVVAFLLIGKTKFAAMMGGLGQGLNSFRKGLTESSSAMGLDKAADQAKPAAEPGSPGVS